MAPALTTVATNYDKVALVTAAKWLS